MDHNIKTNYWFGDTVYLRVNEDKKKGMVVGIHLRPGSQTSYSVCWAGGTETCHYEMELTSEYIPEYAENAHIQGKKE